MLVKLVEHSAKRFGTRSLEAKKAPDQGATKHVKELLQARKNFFVTQLASPIVNFIDAENTCAKVSVGKLPVRERVVSISVTSPNCECGAFKVDSIPCGCMVFVGEKAGASEQVESFVEVTDTNQFLKTLYTDLPPFVVPGTESFSESSGVVLSSDHPQAAGRPSSKRKKSAMDYVAGAAHKARHANAIE
jgi:hypothetical protein